MTNNLFLCQDLQFRLHIRLTEHNKALMPAQAPTQNTDWKPLEDGIKHSLLKILCGNLLSQQDSSELFA